MSKKHFIALADFIERYNRFHPDAQFSKDQIEGLADLCASENPAFKRERWMDYIAGKCGPSGGA